VKLYSANSNLWLYKIDANAVNYLNWVKQKANLPVNRRIEEVKGQDFLVTMSLFVFNGLIQGKKNPPDGGFSVSRIAP
jgi:hypothetical protein